MGEILQVKCPNCEKEYKVVKIIKNKMTDKRYQVHEIPDGAVILQDGEQLICLECGTKIV